MNFMNNVANVDYDDLDAIVMWQKSMVEFFEKFGFSKNQLLKLMGEVAGDTVVHMGANQSLRTGNDHRYPESRREANGHLLGKTLVGNPSP